MAEAENIVIWGNFRSLCFWRRASKPCLFFPYAVDGGCRQQQKLRGNNSTKSRAWKSVGIPNSNVAVDISQSITKVGNIAMHIYNAGIQTMVYGNIDYQTLIRWCQLFSGSGNPLVPAILFFVSYNDLHFRLSPVSIPPPVFPSWLKLFGVSIYYSGTGNCRSSAIIHVVLRDGW